MPVVADSPTAESALRDGDLARSLQLLQEQVRAKPADAGLRIFLFQLLCVMGRWDRALNQLAVSADLDTGAQSMLQTYREAIRCEQLRQEVFLGKRTPLLLGEPAAWVARLVEALALDAKGSDDEAREMRAQAFEMAPACAGSVDDRRFAWIADADMRLGPVLEAVIHGKYYWVPVSHLARMEIEPPADLRDCVWTAAQLSFVNGGECVALLPTRYPGTDLSDPALALARRTDWREAAPGVYLGAGQRVFATDQGDCSLMDSRVIAVDRAVA
jgi:type VI secretion system protein ImpE